MNLCQTSAVRGGVARAGLRSERWTMPSAEAAQDRGRGLFGGGEVRRRWHAGLREAHPFLGQPRLDEATTIELLERGAHDRVRARPEDPRGVDGAPDDRVGLAVVPALGDVVV